MERAGSEQARPPRSKARRSRAARACDVCRRKKNKCDENMPCGFCRQRGLECVYQGGWDRNDESIRVRELEQRVKYLVDALASRDQNDAVTSPATFTAPAISPRFLASQPEASSASEQVPDGSNVEHVALPLVPTPGSTSTQRAAKQEVSGINKHTNNVEFYGTSSSVALLSHIQRNEVAITETQHESTSSALLSSLHNPALHASRHRPPTQRSAVTEHRAKLPGFSHCRNFLNSYFTATHYIHPILDKDDFMQECEALWSGQLGAPEVVSSFTALYYSVLSLSALIGARDEEPIDGIANIEWSRIFFEEARSHCNDLGMTTDLEMVQCYFFLAKVCQNELSPHLSYMYVGQAVRTALAIGINRDPGPNSHKKTAQLKAESRTWWGLYALETEMSFASGRPDTLGADIYHNRSYPLIRYSPNTEADGYVLEEPPHCGIIEHLVKLSRITRTVCLGIYLSETGAPGIMDLAHKIERDLVSWISELPDIIRPDVYPAERPFSLRAVKNPQWAKRQRLVLTIRYHNLRILLFGSLLLNTSLDERRFVAGSSEAIKKCLDSATKTIELIYQTYQHNDFFRTWFYNTTYTVFAASMILVYIRRQADEAEKSFLFSCVDMAVEILEIMDECVVALQAARLLRNAKEKAQTMSHVPATGASTLPQEGNMLINHYWGALDLLDSDMDLNFAFQLAEFDASASNSELSENSRNMLARHQAF